MSIPLPAATARRLAWAAPLLERINRFVPLDLGAISIMAGLRAALACALPVLLGELTGNNHLSWIAIAAFWGCLADTGGAWSDRVLAMGAFTLIGAVGCFLGTLVDPYAAAAVAFTLVWCFLCSLARVYGNAAATVGLLLNSAILVTLGVPAGGLAEALQLAALTVAGGLWAMFLALVLWRLQPYGPAVRAVARCWLALAGYAAGLSQQLRGAGGDSAQWSALSSARRRSTREAIEHARDVLVATRRARAGNTNRGQGLLALLADADQVYAALIGMNELLEASAGAADPGVRRAVRVLLGRLAGRAEALAQALEGETPPAAADFAPAAERLRRRIAASGRQDAYVYTVELLQQVARWIEAAFDNLGEARARQTHLTSMVEQAVARRVQLSELLGTLRANLHFGSVAFRHALRLALTAAAAVLATRLFDISRGYWISITAIVVLQPYMVETWRRTFDRIAGSVLGGLVAAWLMQLVGAPLQMALLIFPLSVVAFALRSVNYALFMLCMTPLVVLISELFRNGGIGDAHLAALRALDSILGGALGLAASFLLWPSWETPQLPRQLGDAVRAHRDYLLVVLGGKPDAKDQDIGAARRQAGLASNNAEASLQRVLSETRVLSRRGAEHALVVLACLRRMAGAVVTLSLLPQLVAGKVDAQRFGAVRRWADESLSEIAQALEQRRAPAALPAPPEALAAVVKQAEAGLAQTPTEVILWNELLRFRRQLEVLHESAGRIAGEPLRQDAAGAAPAARG
ncbi:MAG TPA: FUSC family protein [Nevskia sp.]|nr:FUSC family protein [Nevskia sp.]